MNAVIHQLVAVHAVLLLEIGVKAGFDIVDDRFPACTYQL
jgi:hypothetical protein